MLRCGCREAGQRERRRQHMLPEARMWILRIERIDQQRIPRPYRSRNVRTIEQRRPAHFGGNPAASGRSRKRLIGYAHDI